jgi:hypothetical protein
MEVEGNQVRKFMVFTSYFHIHVCLGDVFGKFGMCLGDVFVVLVENTSEQFLCVLFY